MKIFSNSAVGMTADIISGMYEGEWGTIQHFDGECYHVALWGDLNTILVFEPYELHIRR